VRLQGLARLLQPVCLLGARPTPQKPFISSACSELIRVLSHVRSPSPARQVHAFNTLSRAFHDSGLILPTSAFVAPGASAAGDASDDASWEVRNAASLAFTSLLVRLVGYKNAGLTARAKFGWACWGPAAPGAAGASDPAGAGGNGGGGSAGAGVVANQAYAKAPTTAEFFERFPGLHAYMLRHLRATAAALGRGGSGGGTEGSGSGADGGGGAAHPALFRVLLVLARLKPSVVFSRSAPGGPLSPAALVEPLLAVGRSAAMGVRQLAAAALGPLAPADGRLALAAALAAALPGGPGGVSDHNALHGALLQLEVLLETEAAATAAASSGGAAKDEGSSGDGGSGGADNGAAAAAAAAAAASDAVAAALVDAAWLGGPRCRCPPVRAAFLRAGGAALRLQLQALGRAPDGSGGGGSDAAAVARLAAALEAVCRNAVAGTVPAASGAAESGTDPLPQHAVWLKQSACLLLGPLAAAPAVLAPAAGSGGVAARLVAQLAERLALALGSSEYEVRAAACKVAARQLPPPALAAADAVAASEVAALRAAAWAALEREENPKVRRRLLALAAALQACAAGVPDGVGAAPAAAAPDGALERVAQARAALDAASDLEARAEALGCLAAAVRAAAGGGGGADAEAAAAAAGVLAATLADAARTAQPDALRLAAAGALGGSGLLRPLADAVRAAGAPAVAPVSTAVEALEQASLAAWWTAATLLEDDADAVRAAAAAAAQAALEAAAGAGPEQRQGQQDAEEAGPRGARLYEEAVKPRVFDLLASACASARSDAVCRAAAARLAAAVFDPAAAPLAAALEPLGGAAAAAAGASGDAADTEGANGAQAAPAAAATGGVIPESGISARRLFDREADNHHEEPLQVAQAAAAALAARLPALPPGGAAGDALAAWGAAAGAWLEGFAAALRAAPGMGAGAWVGGACAHPDAFAPLCRCLLAVWACGAHGDGWRGADSARAALRAAGPPPVLAPLLAPGGRGGDGVLFLLQ
jgi:hypothetical protein